MVQASGDKIRVVEQTAHLCLGPQCFDVLQIILPIGGDDFHNYGKCLAFLLTERQITPPAEAFLEIVFPHLNADQETLATFRAGNGRKRDQPIAGIEGVAVWTGDLTASQVLHKFFNVVIKHWCLDNWFTLRQGQIAPA